MPSGRTSCWNFQPTICSRPIQRAAKNDSISLVDSPINANSATKSRMMPIKKYARSDPVGVLKRCCTIAAVPTRALTAAHLIKPTSPHCQSAWQPNPGRGSTFQRGDSVQTTGTSSVNAGHERRERNVLGVVSEPPRQVPMRHSRFDLRLGRSSPHCSGGARVAGPPAPGCGAQAR